MKKIVSCFIILNILIGLLSLSVSASNYIVSPYMNNGGSTSTEFTIDSAGKGTVSVYYYDGTKVVTGATIKTKIQKNFLFFFWTDVDIGVENNTWVDECVGHTYFGTHSVNLGSGTYKAIVEYTIRGTGGEPDVITQEIERTH